MTNRLKQITTKAKSLYKTGKYKKWTDAIKAASKNLPSSVKKSKVGAVKKEKSFSVKVGDKFQIGDLQYLVTKTGINKGIEYAMKWKWEKNFDYPASKRINYSNLAFDGIFNQKNKIGKISGIKKSEPKKKAVKSYHKDTKSHNVNIRVISGINDLERLKQAIKTKENLESTYRTVKTSIPKYRSEFDKMMLKTLPQLIKQEKIIIATLKKNVK